MIPCHPELDSGSTYLIALIPAFAGMTRNMNFNDKVYAIVKKIPRGKVITYGEIARKLGNARWSRQVGWALHANKPSLRSSDASRPVGLKSVDVPCHRVVDRTGRVAPNFAFDGVEEQKRRLEVEGVGFVDNMHVDSSFIE